MLRHDGGPADHIATLGNSLRKLLDERRDGSPPFFVLVAGGAQCAWLRFNTPDFSLFSGVPVRHVAALTEAEVSAALDGVELDGARHAADVYRATGGHPGLVEEILLGRGALDFASLPERLAQSPSVRGVLRMRLSKDDREGHPPRRHARWAPGELLGGRRVRKLAEIEDERGQTAFRCEAARRAAAQVFSLEDGP